MTVRSNAVAALYAQALALYERGDAGAAAAFEAVLANDPAHVGARYKLANVHKDAGALAAAAAGYETVLRHDPAHAEALNNLGAVWQQRGDAAAAEDCYLRAIAANPMLAAPAANLGRLLQEQGRGADAARVFAEARSRGLDAGLFGHLHAAATGEDSARARVLRARNFRFLCRRLRAASRRRARLSRAGRTRRTGAPPRGGSRAHGCSRPGLRHRPRRRCARAAGGNAGGSGPVAAHA